MASPLFNPKNRPKNPLTLGAAEIQRFQAAWNNEGPIVVSVDSAPGLFLLATESLAEGKGVELRVPESWKREPPRVHVLPATSSASITNGRETRIISRPIETTSLITAAFRDIGCEVIEGPPSRFDRKPVI